ARPSCFLVEQPGDLYVLVTPGLAIAQEVGDGFGISRAEAELAGSRLRQLLVNADRQDIQLRRRQLATKGPGQDNPLTFPGAVLAAGPTLDRVRAGPQGQDETLRVGSVVSPSGRSRAVPVHAAAVVAQPGPFDATATVVNQNLDGNPIAV